MEYHGILVSFDDVPVVQLFQIASHCEGTLIPIGGEGCHKAFGQLLSSLGKAFQLSFPYDRFSPIFHHSARVCWVDYL